MDEASLAATPDLSGGDGEEQTFVTFRVAGQRLGVPAVCLRDILVPERIARVPGAPAAVRGRIDLRGRTATVVDMRARLGLPVRGDAKLGMGVTVEHRGELYTLLVDRVGDIVCLPPHVSDDAPPTLDAAWRGVSSGVHRPASWWRSTSTGCSTSPEPPRRIRAREGARVRYLMP